MASRRLQTSLRGIRSRCPPPMLLLMVSSLMTISMATFTTSTSSSIAFQTSVKNERQTAFGVSSSFVAVNGRLDHSRNTILFAPVPLLHASFSSQLYLGSGKKKHLSHGAAPKGDENAAATKPTIQSVATFLVAQLQLIAMAKAMEAERTGKRTKQTEKLMEGLEKLMEIQARATTPAPAPTEEVVEVDEPVKMEKEAPLTTPTKVSMKQQETTTSTATAKQDDTKMETPPATLNVLDKMVPGKKIVGDSIPATQPEEKTDKSATTIVADPSPSSTAASDEIVPKDLDSKEEEKRTVVVEKDKTEEDQGPPVLRRFEAKLPSCVSTDFGQALPVTVEDLPPLREPLVNSVQTESAARTALASNKEDTATTTTTPFAVAPPPVSAPEATDKTEGDNTDQKIEESELKNPDDSGEKEVKTESDNNIRQKAKVLPTPPSMAPNAGPVSEKTTAESANKEEESNDGTESSSRVWIPPPPPSKDEDSEQQEVSSDASSSGVSLPPATLVESKDDATEDTSSDNSEATRVAVPLPPPQEQPKGEKTIVEDDTAEIEDEKKTPSRVLIPPPPTSGKVDGEKKNGDNTEEDGNADPESNESNQDAVSSAIEAPVPASTTKAKGEDKITSAEPIPSDSLPAASVRDDDDASKRYASMPLEERAASILKDLGMVKPSSDPDDPNYDHSTDDDLCPDNVWKEKKS